MPPHYIEVSSLKTIKSQWGEGKHGRSKHSIRARTHRAHTTFTVFDPKISLGFSTHSKYVIVTSSHTKTNTPWSMDTVPLQPVAQCMATYSTCALHVLYTKLRGERRENLCVLQTKLDATQHFEHTDTHTMCLLSSKQQLGTFSFPWKSQAFLGNLNTGYQHPPGHQ